MDKPMFYFGSAYFWTLMAVALTGLPLAYGLAALSAATGGFLLWKMKHTFGGTRKLRFFLAVAGIVLLACLAVLLQTKLIYEPVMERAGEDFTGTFVVTETLNDSSTGAHRCVVAVEGERKMRHLRLSSTTYEPRVGDVFSGTVSLKTLGEQDPAVARYYKSRGLYLGATSSGRITADPFDVVAARGDIKASPVRLAWWSIRLKLETLREHFTGSVEDWLKPEEAGVLNGMLVGERSGLSTDTNDAFRRAGVMHLFAVSGFHVSLWAMLVYKFFLSLGAGRRTSGGGALLFLFLFVALTGFSRSAVRAGIMLGVFFLGRILARSPEALNSLGVAALLIVLPNPFYAGDTGVLLSYFATLGILSMYPPLAKDLRENYLKLRFPNYKTRKRVEKVLMLLVLTFCTFLATLPVLTLSFGNVSLMTFLSNLLVSSASSAAILLTGVGALCALLPGLSLMTPWCFLGAGLLARGMVRVCTLLSTLPFAYVSLTGRGFGVGLAAALLLATAGFVLYGALPDRGLVRMTALLSAIVLLGSVLTDTALHRDVIKVTFIDVKGTCVALTYRHGACVIGCGSDAYGTEQGLSDLLQREGVSKVSALVVPRDSGTEAGALEAARDVLSPETVLQPDDFAGPTVQSFRLFPEVRLFLYRQDGEYPAGLLDVRGVRFLLLFRPTVRVEELPPDAQNAPVCFLRGNRPEGLKLTPSSYIIVSGETGEVEARVAGERFRLYRR